MAKRSDPEAERRALQDMGREANEPPGAPELATAKTGKVEQELRETFGKAKRGR